MDVTGSGRGATGKKKDRMLRQYLIELIEGKQAHASVKTILDGVPSSCYTKKVRKIPYTLWDLLEHIRLSQADILKYMTDRNYLAPDWPDEYWPIQGQPSVEMWEKSVKDIFRGIAVVKRLVKDQNVDLLSPVPAGEKGHTLCREILLLVDHNSYHLGQMVVLRRLLGIWEND